MGAITGTVVLLLAGSVAAADTAWHKRDEAEKDCKDACPPGVVTCTKQPKMEGFNTGFVHTFNTKEGETSPGDIWTWHANVQDAATGEKAGELTGFAINVPTNKWETQETISLPGGDIFCHYVQKGTTTSIAGITGGTGEYVSASGQIEFTAPEDATANGPWGIDMTVCVPDGVVSNEF